MKCRGEYIGVNLRTGERIELIAGDGSWVQGCKLGCTCPACLDRKSHNEWVQLLMDDVDFEPLVEFISKLKEITEMTIRIKIENMDPRAGAVVEVTYIDPVTAKQLQGLTQYTIQGKESCELYVHAGQSIMVKEIRND